MVRATELLHPQRNRQVDSPGQEPGGSRPPRRADGRAFARGHGRRARASACLATGFRARSPRARRLEAHVSLAPPQSPIWNFLLPRPGIPHAQHRKNPARSLRPRGTKTRQATGTARLVLPKPLNGLVGSTQEPSTSGLPVTRPRSAATLLNLPFPQSNGRFGCFSERILYVSKCLFSQGVRTRMPAIGPVQSSI